MALSLSAHRDNIWNKKKIMNKLIWNNINSVDHKQYRQKKNNSL